MSNTSRKIVDAVIALVIAVALWAFVINVVNPPDSKVIREVPVNITGLESLTRAKLAVAGELDYTVDVVVSGSRAELADVNPDNVFASADISSLQAGQNYVNVKVNIPESVSLEDVRSSKIQVVVDELVTENKTLNIAYGIASDGYETTVLRYGSGEIAVSGAKSLVSLVSEVRVDLNSADLVVDSPRTQTLEGLPLDKDGNIISAVKLPEGGISVTAALYPLKTVPLEVPISGEPAYKASVRTVDVPGTITIKGPSEKLELVDSVTAEPINIDGIVEDMSYTVSPKLSTNIEVADNCKSIIAKVNLVNVGQSAFDFTPEELKVEGLGEGLEYTFAWSSNISVTAHSTLTKLDGLTKEQIAPKLDLSFLEPGVHEVEIETDYTDGDISFTFAPSYMTVVISDPNAEEHTQTEEGEGTQTEE